MTPLLAQRPRTDRSFERIYRRHVGDVYRYALAVLRQPADAEDVTQTTFMNAYRAFQRGERPRNAQNWLIAIAHNVCRQRFRQAARRPDEIAYEDGIGDVMQDEEQGPSAEDIQRALGHLAFNQRAALVMRELEGRSYVEISEILGLSVSAVETLLFRARRALREQLEGALTCTEAERAISRRADGQVSRAERGSLRAHLRECKECERFARSQRAHRNAFKALAAVPIPSSLTTFFGGGGGAALGGGVALKAAAFVTAGVVATGVGYEGVKRAELVAPKPHRSAAATHVVPSSPAAARTEHIAVSPAAPTRDARAANSPAKANPPSQVKPEHAAKPEVASAGKAQGHGRSSAPGATKQAVSHGRSGAAKGARGHQRPTHVAKPKRTRPANVGQPAEHRGRPIPAPAPAPAAAPGKPDPKPDQPGKGKEKVLPDLPVELPLPTP
jgi:RNA polymerase sigma factor (sigma-70 family)